MGTKLILLLIAAASAVTANEVVINNDLPAGDFIEDPLTELMRSIREQELANPGLFDPKDLEEFLRDEGPVAASRFLNQRGGSPLRAIRLAHDVLKWRKAMELNFLEAGLFPCDLFEMGLIFEHGHAHKWLPTGEYVSASPVIWIRLGALGSIAKQLERFTPERLTSFVANTARQAMHRFRDKVSSSRERRLKPSNRQQRAARHAERGPLVRDLSVRENTTVMHLLRALAWWLENWVRTQPAGSKATLVLDFEDTDFAHASWTVGEFLLKLDDRFPDLFDLILDFRYRAKIWSLHAPISMFNRIFKSRFSSSPETNRKLRFVDKEEQISAYMPRVYATGQTMLPKHVVSRDCTGPDPSKAPAGCQPVPTEASATGLFDPNLWQAIYNEFYYQCKPTSR